MRSRFVIPAVGLVGGAVGAWSFLQWSDTVTRWIPTSLVSGSYNSILFVVGGSFGVLLYRFLARGESPVLPAGAGFRLDTGRTVRLLSVVAASLVWVNVFDFLLKWAVRYEYRPVMPLYALEKEGNLPTLFASASLLFCALLLALVARAKSPGDRDRAAWLGLAALFAFLTLDEFAGLHERLVSLGKTLLSGPAPFGREWVIVYGLLLVPVGLLFVPFLRRLPEVTRRIWLVAGVVFVVGALGLEMLTGWLSTQPAGGTAVWAFNIIEETLEMGGVLLFLYGLLDYIETEVGSLEVLPVARRA